MIKSLLRGLPVIGLLSVWGCETLDQKPENDSPEMEITIQSATITGPPVTPFDSIGDIWMSTWADDDKIYITWADGCGPAQTWGDPYVEELNTDAGVAGLAGSIGYFTNTQSPFDCIRSIHVPDGIAWDSLVVDDKPSSVLFCDGILYFAGHSPLGDPEVGYIAYSLDYGLTWEEVPNSPWTAANNSVFRILMLINMGRNYELNSDGFVYGLGIGHEWDWPTGSVYLTRVSKSSIIDYNQYQYYADTTAGGEPVWSDDQADAAPVPGLLTYNMGSAIFHEGTQQYLFLRSWNFYAAPNPWGPWYPVPFLVNEFTGNWLGGYMPGMITKDAGPDYLYFTLAGSDSVISYQFHLGKIELQTIETTEPNAGEN